MMVRDWMLSDNEGVDAIAKQFYEIMLKHPKRTYDFVDDLRDAVGCYHFIGQEAIKVLKKNDIIQHVGDNKFRFTKAELERIENASRPQTQWTPQPVVLEAVVPEEHQPTPEPEAPHKKMAPGERSAQILKALEDLGEATSVEIATLLDIPPNTAAAALSWMWSRKQVQRTPIEKGFKYLPIRATVVEEPVHQTVLVGPGPQNNVMDPMRRLYLQSLYERIIKGEPLNDYDKEALKMALFSDV